MEKRGCASYDEKMQSWCNRILKASGIFPSVDPVDVLVDGQPLDCKCMNLCFLCRLFRCFSVYLPARTANSKVGCRIIITLGNQ